MNAASISSAIIPRSVDCYKNVLEVFEIEERTKQTHCIMLSRCTILKRVRVAQREARDVVKQTRRNDHRHHISSDGLYRGVLYKNGRLLSMARDASHVLYLIKDKVIYKGGTSFELVDRQVTPSSHDIIIAYHELAVLIRLKLLTAMSDRLGTMCKRKIRKMLYVATYLACYCPDKEKIRLGISRTGTLGPIPWSWFVDNWDVEFIPRCHLIVPARRAFFAVADMLGEPSIPDHILENRSRCNGDCEASVKTHEM